MPPDKGNGRVVFVGNIPYGLTEEQIIHIFSQAGTVTSFRLVYDKETGRPKGFGFAEYQEADQAASAVRNLNDHEVMNRKLRVDFSNDGGHDDAAPPGYVPQPLQPTNGVGQAPPPGSSQQHSSSLPPLPPGVDVPPGLSCPDAISQTLSALPAPQLLDILNQMKTLVVADPNKATELLKQAPQLSYAIFQALLLMGLVDATALQSVIEQAPVQPGAPIPLTAPSGTAPVQPIYQTPMPQLPLAAPSQQAQAYAPPPFQAPQPPTQLAPGGADRAALMQAVLSITPDQLNAMQPVEREQVLAVRQQIMTGQFR